jgi:hypothetical protein
MMPRINRGDTPVGFNGLVFVTETDCVLCKIGTEFLIIICMIFGLKVVNPLNHYGNYIYQLFQC